MTARAAAVLFFSGDDVNEPVAVRVDSSGATDEHGRPVDDGAHHASLEAAWEAIERDIQAQASLAGRDVAELERRLASARAEAGRACKRWDEMQRKRRSWKK